MYGLSAPHLIVLGVVVLVLFGRGRISEAMGDFGRGISAFRQGVADGGRVNDAPPPALGAPPHSES